ncbi:MAG: hypothetical protein FWE65_00210 [Eggerthellaceae bacterium]|nr:hypothetical protein [Eggerthellaceae bacterium]
MGRSGGIGGKGLSGGGRSIGGISGGSRSSGGFSGGRPTGGPASGGRSYSGSPFSSPSTRPSSSPSTPTFVNLPLPGSGSPGFGGSGGGSFIGGLGGSGSGGSFVGGPYYSPQKSPANSSGCGWRTIVTILAIIFIIWFIFGMADCSSNAVSNTDITKSSVVRVALPSSAVTETDYYTDADGDWIHRPGTLVSGMRSFYQETGVQPYLYILPNGKTTSVDELTGYATDLYDQLFVDEAHFLLVFCDDGKGSYNCGYLVGAQAKTIMDQEAIMILGDYLDRYYNDLSLREEEIFSKAFADTGKRIMRVEKSPLVPILLCLTALIITVAVYFIVKKRREQREQEQKRMEEILRTPIEKFGDYNVESLARKYEEQIPNNNQTGENKDGHSRPFF